MRTDATKILAAERQEPYTAAEHAEAEGHQDEYARDVPRTCTCLWTWTPAGKRYVTISRSPDCPWHTCPEHTGTGREG